MHASSRDLTPASAADPPPRLSALRAAWLGAVAGGVAGAAEPVYTALAWRTTLSATDVVSVSIFYTVTWGLFGLVLGTLAWALSAARRRSPGPLGPGPGPALVALVFLVTAAGIANFEYAGSRTSGRALVFDLVFLALAGLVWWASRCIAAALARRRRTTRRSISPLGVVTLVLVAAVGTAALLPGERAWLWHRDHPTRTDGPNILFLLVDALRADHLGCYGYDRPTSPTIDRLASEGFLATRAIAQSSWTKGSTAAIVTSLYASTSNVKHPWDALPESAPTLMEAMRDANYRTAVISANPIIVPLFGFGRGTDLMYCETVPAARMSVLAEIGRRIGFRLPHASRLGTALEAMERASAVPRGQIAYEGGRAPSLNAAFLAWIDRNPGVRFFAYLHYMDVHMPYDPPPPYDSMFDPGYEGKPMTIVEPEKQGIFVPFDHGTRLSPSEEHNLVARYDGSIAYFDAELSKLLDELKKRGLADDTIIVVTADHGEGFYDHSAWGHSNSIYQELIHVPLILWWSGDPAPGTVERGIVRQVDYMPTFLDAVGLGDVSQTLDLEGLDLWPYLANGEPVPQDLEAFSEVYRLGRTGRSLISGDLKVIHASYGDEERSFLFDLASDPSERQDLSQDDPSLTAGLLSSLAATTAEAESTKRESRRQELDEAMKERLRALGYVQ